MSIKISELPSADSVNDNDIIPIVQEGTTKKAQVSQTRTQVETTINSSSTNDKVAGAKAVYDYSAPINHSSENTTYGQGTSTKFGHCKTIDNLTTSTYTAGESLSAHQGYVLDQGKQDKLAINLTQNLILQNGTAPTLVDGKYFTNGYKVYVNGTEFAEFDNCIFSYGHDQDEGIYTFVKNDSTGFASIEYYDDLYTTVTSTPLLASSIDTTMPGTPRNYRVPSTKLLYDQLEEKQTEIETLQAENEALLDQIPTATASGNPINVQDSSNLPITEFDLLGNATQITTTGKNLFSGWVPGSVNPYTGEFSTSERNRSDYIQVSSSTTYTMWRENTGFAMYAIEYDTNKQFVITRTMTSANTKHVFTTEATTSYVVFYQYTSYAPTYKAMLEVGNIESPTYEPYTGGTPAPNPDYPQDIHVVTGDNTVVVNGKNLLKLDTISASSFNTTTFTSIGNIIEMRNTYNNLDRTLEVGINYIKETKKNSYDWTQAIKFKKLKPSTQYKLSCKVETNISSGNVNIFGSNVAYNTTEFSRNMNTDSNGEATLGNHLYSATSGLGTGTYVYLTDIQLEEGTTQTEYETPTEQTQLLPLGNIELAKIGDYQDKLFKAIEGTKDNPTFYDTLPNEVKSTLTLGAWYKQGNIGKVTYTGKTSELWQVFHMGSDKEQFFIDKTGIFHNINTYNCMSNYYKMGKFSERFSILETVYSYNGGIAINTQQIHEVTDFKTWLSSNNLLVYYILATPTYTEITDTTLIGQLENILKMHTNKNVTNISIEPSGTNAQGGLVVGYRQDIQTLFNNITTAILSL